MENNEIIKILEHHFPKAILGYDETYDTLSLIIGAEFMHSVISLLKTNETLSFRFLTDITAVHYPENEKQEFCVVYHLHNMAAKKRIRLKIFVSKDKPEVPTVTDLFSSANWMERETYDFYGIVFTSHPNLIRILNVEYLDYFPLRKEYPLEDPTRTDKTDSFFGR